MDLLRQFKPIFHLATLFARREAKIRIRQRDWLTLVGEKIRREQVETVPPFSCSREQFRQVENELKTKWELALRLETECKNWNISMPFGGCYFRRHKCDKPGIHSTVGIPCCGLQFRMFPDLGLGNTYPRVSDKRCFFVLIFTVRCSRASAI